MQNKIRIRITNKNPIKGINTNVNPINYSAFVKMRTEFYIHFASERITFVYWHFGIMIFADIISLWKN